MSNIKYKIHLEFFFEFYVSVEHTKVLKIIAIIIIFNIYRMLTVCGIIQHLHKY